MSAHVMDDRKHLTINNSFYKSNRLFEIIKVTKYIKPGRVGVLLDGEPNPISLKLKNVQTVV